MTQKQVVLVVLAVVVIAVVSIFVYRQYTSEHFDSMPTVTQTSKSVTATPRVIVPVERTVPSNIDDITAEIGSEAVADTAALDAEESGELSEISDDSNSINSLSTSYDENSF